MLKLVYRTIDLRPGMSFVPKMGLQNPIAAYIVLAIGRSSRPWMKTIWLMKAFSNGSVLIEDFESYDTAEWFTRPRDWDALHVEDR